MSIFTSNDNDLGDGIGLLERVDRVRNDRLAVSIGLAFRALVGLKQSRISFSTIQLLLHFLAQSLAIGATRHFDL